MIKINRPSNRPRGLNRKMKKSVNQYPSKKCGCADMYVPPSFCTCTLMCTCVCVCVCACVCACVCVCVCVCVLPSCWAVQCGAARGDILPEGQWKCSAAPVSWSEEDKMENKQGWFTDIHDHQNDPNFIKGHLASFAYTVRFHSNLIQLMHCPSLI